MIKVISALLVNNVGDSRTAKMAGFFYSIDCSEGKNTDL